MTDYYLRAATAEAMQAALGALPSGVTIDEIGVIYRVLVDGESVEALPGYHANVRSTGSIVWPAGIEQLSPNTPWRVFA
jgi:hypothetical protein